MMEKGVKSVMLNKSWLQLQVCFIEIVDCKVQLIFGTDPDDDFNLIDTALQQKQGKRKSAS